MICLLMAGCGGGNDTQSALELSAAARLVRVGTAPPGGTFHIVGHAVAAVLEGEGGEGVQWKPEAVETKGSLDNIERLKAGQLDLALANAATTYFASLEGYPMRAIMTMAPNIAMFVTRKESGIRRISDLTNKRVTIGPEGAGFEFFLMPIFVAHNENFEGVEPVYSSQAKAVELLAAGEVEAAFLGGGVPTESITRACQLMDVYFVPFDDLPTKVLKQEFVFFDDAVIPAGTYPGQLEDFQGLNVGSMHLITSAGVEEETVYQLTKTIYENREAIAAKHPAGKAINPKNVVKETGTPFHEGAIRYYKEIGIWPENTP